jgi:hypothetical protein
MSHSFHKLWIRVCAVIIGCFAPAFFLGSMSSTVEPARLTLDLLSWPVDGRTTFAAADTRFLSALTGGFLFGWSVTVWQLATHLYDIAPEGVRRTIISGLVAWFLLDSAGSLASGNGANALINVFVLVVAAGPLWRPAKANLPQGSSEVSDKQ